MAKARSRSINVMRRFSVGMANVLITNELKSEQFYNIDAKKNG
jgi:hypothetical protein